MKILIAGGTGFIGQPLCDELIKSGHELTILSRTKGENTKSKNYILWEEQDKLKEIINEIDIVINLSGEPIAKKRWTREQKDLLYKSRIVTTQILVNAINNAVRAYGHTPRPKKLINASAVGIYGSRGNEKITDKNAFDEMSLLGNDFLTNICKEWESEARKVETSRGTSLVILRLGIVLGAGGGALEKMLPPFQMFAGGPLGNGNQYMSWIHVDDVIGLIKFAIENENVTGILNATAPNPVTNKEFSNILGKVLNRPSFMPVPDFALKLLLGEMSELLLTGQNVIPERALESGYKFKYEKLRDALEDILE